MKRTKLKDRILPKYSKGEEIFNMTSHIVGGALGIVALVLCVVFAAIHHNGYGVVSGAIYGVTMIFFKAFFKKSISSTRPLLNIFTNSRIIHTILPMHIQRIQYSTRMDNFWNNMGNSNTRNSIKLNRHKKIQSIFNDMLFSYGMVYYC